MSSYFWVSIAAFLALTACSSHPDAKNTLIDARTKEQNSSLQHSTGDVIEERLIDGAKVFSERCSLCHGNNAMGDGILPLLKEDYPSTNILESRFGTTEKAIKKVVVFGGINGDMDALSPPWEDELSSQEIDAVVGFVAVLHYNQDRALRYLDAENDRISPSLSKGDQLFRTRCVICHGSTGEGDGRLSAIIMSPPPANLRESTKPGIYLTRIISEGGKSLGRSERMPPWAGTLRKSEIESLASYLLSIQSKNVGGKQ